MARTRLETGPRRAERRRQACRLLVHGVVEEIPEGRDDALIGRAVVVRPEDGNEVGVAPEGFAQAPERVSVHDHVGVDEDKHVTCRSARAVVACARRPGAARAVDDDDLFRRLIGTADCGQARGESARLVRRRDNCRQARHRRIVRPPGPVPAGPLPGSARRNQRTSQLRLFHTRRTGRASSHQPA